MIHPLNQGTYDISTHDVQCYQQRPWEGHLVNMPSFVLNHAGYSQSSRYMTTFHRTNDATSAEFLHHPLLHTRKWYRNLHDPSRILPLTNNQAVRKNIGLTFVHVSLNGGIEPVGCLVWRWMIIFISVTILSTSSTLIGVSCKRWSSLSLETMWLSSSLRCVRWS